MTPEELQYCEQEGCAELATMTVSGPSWVDWFGPYELCDKHGDEMAENVRFHKVDGLGLEEIADVLAEIGKAART